MHGQKNIKMFDESLVFSKGPVQTVTDENEIRSTYFSGD